VFSRLRQLLRWIPKRASPLAHAFEDDGKEVLRRAALDTNLRAYGNLIQPCALRLYEMPLAVK
jgi:hypothetical protein